MEKREATDLIAPTITTATHEVFMSLAKTSEGEGRNPEVTHTSNQWKGHLMNLKKAGLITTYVCDGDPDRVLWVGFTEAGYALARSNDVFPFDHRE